MCSPIHAVKYRALQMPAKTLADLVKDWGGFEKLVADLSQTGEVTVEHNVNLTGRSGARALGAKSMCSSGTSKG